MVDLCMQSPLATQGYRLYTGDEGGSHPWQRFPSHRSPALQQHQHLEFLGSFSYLFPYNQISPAQVRVMYKQAYLKFYMHLPALFESNSNQTHPSSHSQLEILVKGCHTPAHSRMLRQGCHIPLAVALTWKLFEYEIKKIQVMLFKTQAALIANT